MATPETSSCPRCGAAFHCGARDAEPCACTGVKLDDATLIALRVRYEGCLCLTCLREIQRGGKQAPSRAGAPSR